MEYACDTGKFRCKNILTSSKTRHRTNDDGHLHDFRNRSYKGCTNLGKGHRKVHKSRKKSHGVTQRN